jgi:hypothetical protein
MAWVLDQVFVSVQDRGTWLLFQNFARSVVCNVALNLLYLGLRIYPAAHVQRFRPEKFFISRLWGQAGARLSHIIMNTVLLRCALPRSPDDSPRDTGNPRDSRCVRGCVMPCARSTVLAL